MKRIIVDRIPDAVSVSNYEWVLTPTKAIASSLALKKFTRNIKTSHHTLESLAETIVKKKGLKIASILLTRHTLQNAIAEILKVKDLVGITALWTPIIQELFSSGSDLLALQKHSMTKVSNLAKVAIFYQEQLRKINCIDRSELFWQAAKYCQHKRSCFFYGYFAPDLDRLTFINALSGDKSLLVLPCEVDHIFKHNQDSINWLKAQKWQIIQESTVTHLAKEQRPRAGNPHLGTLCDAGLAGEGGFLNCSSWELTDFCSVLAPFPDRLPQSKVLSLGNKLQQYYLKQQNSSSSSPNTPLSSSEVILNHYPNLEAEVRGVLTQVKLLLDRGINANDIVLVTKDERLYGDTLLDIAWEYGVPLRAFYDVSLLTTRLGAWLQLLLEIILIINSSERLSFEAVIKLLSHPLVKQLDTETWAKARVNHPQTIGDWQTIGIDLSLLQLPIKLASDRWLSTFQHILETFNIPQKVKPWAKEIVAYYKIQEALQELLLTTNKAITRETICTEIQEILASSTIPVQTGRGGVEFHSPLSLFGSKISYVFVLGMAENVFPTAVTDDLVLGFSDRKLLVQENIKINTIAKIMQKEALVFYFLLQIPTKQITFSYPKLIERQPTYPSPYLKTFNLKLTPVEHNYLASIEEVRTRYLPQKETIRLQIDEEIEKKIDADHPKQQYNSLTYIAHKWQIAQDREHKIINEYNGLVGIPLDYQKFIFSASQLTQIGQCPFKWFVARILKLKEIPETKLILENNTRGSLYHQCLELYLSEINTAADLKKFNLQQLKQAFQEAETKLQIPDIPSWLTQKKELLNLLDLNLNAPDFLPQDSKIIAREKEFTTQWHGLNIRGTIDRIDRTSQGIKVIDYKSSSNPPLGIKDCSDKATVDIQIPLYIDAMTQEYPEENIDAVYYSLSKCKPIRRNKTNLEDLANFAKKVKQHLTQGNYPIEPDIQFKACNYCQFDLVCRK